MVTREQIKAARAVLGWSTRDLAERTGVAPNTVSRFENGADALGETLTKLQVVLEAHGIEFVKLDAIRWTRYLETKGQEQSA
jgi:transcriptional regulator with XRE-family HTH domain